MDKNIDAAIQWLCESAILNRDRNLSDFGGVNNGYIWKDKKYQYVYNEITGYAINTFIAAYQWTREDIYLQYAKNAADYLITQQCRNAQAFEYGGISHSLTQPQLKRIVKYYSFDNAVILHGMVNLFVLTKDQKYHEAGIRIGDFLLKMQQDDGAFYSYYDAETREISHVSDEFFFR